MITIKKFECNMLDTNCYVVSDSSKECVIIDCGAWYDAERQAIVNFIDNEGLKPVRLIATHGHLDHNFGNNTICEHYGLQPEVSEEDRTLMEGMKQQAREMFGMTIDYDFPETDHWLKDGESILFGSHKLVVIATPGHSPGCVCLYEPNDHVLFTGDTLFKMSVGRTDLWGGNYHQLVLSMDRLKVLPDDTRILPGHGPQSTIGEEKRYNPYMRRI